MQAPVLKRGQILVASASTINVNDFKTGVTVEIDGTPFKVIGTNTRVLQALDGSTMCMFVLCGAWWLVLHFGFAGYA